MKTKLRGLTEDYKDELEPVNPAEVSYVSYPKNISLDQLVDRYLMQYEKEAIGKGTPKLQEKTWRDEFKVFVKEAAPDAEGVGADPMQGLGGDMGGDTGLGLGSPDAGTAAPPAESGPNVIPPDIDVERFAELLYGLMNNYESLLDPQTTIMNRAVEYIAKNYSPRHAEKVSVFLQTKFGVDFKNRASGAEEHFAAGSFGDAGSSTVSAPQT